MNILTISIVVVFVIGTLIGTGYFWTKGRTRGKERHEVDLNTIGRTIPITAATVGNPGDPGTLNRVEEALSKQSE